MEKPLFKFSLHVLNYSQEDHDNENGMNIKKKLSTLSHCNALYSFKYGDLN